MGVKAYIARRILFMIPVFLGVSVLVFIMMYSAGDPVQLLIRGNPRILQNPDALNAIKSYYGMDKPLIQQYFNWLWNFLHLNLGKSFYGGKPVNQQVASWALTTIELQLVSLVLALLISIYVGILSARKQYSKTDTIVTTTAIFGVSMPTFWFGIILILIFSFYLGLFPSAGAFGATKLWPTLKPVEEGTWFDFLLDHLYHLALPTLVITYANLALYVRIIRANMLEILRQDYILAAKASGIPERKILYSHAFRNVLSPIVTLVGLYFGAIMAGAPITEYVFSWPGLGRYYVQATLVLDYPVVMGITMIIVVMVLVANLITDLMYAVIDPRVRVE
jgi:peptide/nickel transport system permease protein